MRDLYRNEEALEAQARGSKLQMSDICPSALSPLFPFSQGKKSSSKDELGSKCLSAFVDTDDCWHDLMRWWGGRRFTVSFTR